MGLRDKAVEALRNVFGLEREERDSADSPSTLAQANVGPSSYSLSRNEDLGGMLTVSNHLMDRYSDYECLTGDTVVLTLEGPKTLAYLAKRCEEEPGFSVPLYTWDGERITVGIGIDARMTKRDKVYSVYLDDDTIIRGTADHPFMMRDGTYKPIKELQSGDSLMPLYLYRDKRGNQTYSENNDYWRSAVNTSDRKKVRRVARMVAEWKLGHRLESGTVVTLVDGNPSNCSPDNVTHKLIKDRKKAAWLSAVSQANSLIDLNSNMCKPPLNHKVVKIVPGDVEAVYDISVPGTNNFAVGSYSGGIFVHNSMDEYPDINCLAAGTLVAITEGSIIKQVPIEVIASSGDGHSILGYDVKKKNLAKVVADNPRLTGREAEVIALELSNGTILRCTAEHKILTADRGYIDAGELKAGATFLGLFGSIVKNKVNILVNKKTTDITLLKDPYADGVSKVFDITTKTHNFVANGIVVHNSANHYFANDTVQPDLESGRSVWVESPDIALKDAANSLLHRKLRVDDDIFSMAYTLVKYGNNFEELLITDNGVIGMNYLPPPSMRRVEHPNGSVIGYLQDPTGKFTDKMGTLRGMLAGAAEIPPHLALFEDWQVLHMRLRATHRRSPYGWGIADGARWIWKRLTILEDSVMIYRLTRAPSRYAFYIDVTDIPANKVESFLRKAKQDLKKKKIVNPRTGQLEMRYNPMANDEDFFLATRNGQDLARVDVISGPTYQHMEDIEYFQRKLHGVLKVPKEYLGQDQAVPARAILSNEDSRASRVTMNIQKEVKNSMERLIRIDMAARGVSDPFRPEFTVMMTAPSGIYALQALEVRNARADFASRIQPFVSVDWIRRNIFNLTDEEIEVIEKEKKREAELEQQNSPFGGQNSGQSGDVGGEASPSGPAQDLADVDIHSLPTLTERNRGNAPTKPQLQRMLNEQRRLQDLRNRASDRRHEELMARVDQLLRNDSNFALESSRRDAFMNDFKSMMYKNNGRVRTAPANGRHI